MVAVSQIRKVFLEYFQKQGHVVVPSAPLVPHNDPTLMFTNAGMVPFKDVFTQRVKPEYMRATSSQKCVRAGGKHNDLDNVGYTARHHTFFEMLGNFSFGDYFKEKAIFYAWELLTQELRLPKDKLLVTVFHTDQEAFDLWKKIAGISEHKIIRISSSDNFWSMGETGPCGPCSEIFYDHGENIPGGSPGSDDQDGDRFIEIWNLVFMQYEAISSDERVDLPAPSIDTGMGLERIAAVLQGVHDNYDTDLFRALIKACHELTGENRSDYLHSYRVIADHLRSSSFLLADGVMPSNEGRGYVLRRIMRRAMRHVRNLGYEKALMYQLVPSLISQMGEAYPELIRAQGLITEMLKLEEENFSVTLDRGLKLLEKETAHLKKGQALSGNVAFKLYDTYGFPYDLTVDILRNRAFKVDEAGFTRAMEEQKQRARLAWKGSGGQTTDGVWYDIKEAYGATEFIGYENLEAQAQLIAIIKDGVRAKSAAFGEKVLIILNQTPFYAESGGQEGDRGALASAHARASVTDTYKYLGAIHAHSVVISDGTLTVGDVITAHVDEERRRKLRANHSATHILHAVLREVLGEHVTQKGSLVAEERLRFDISHPKALTAEEIEQIEGKVNDIIYLNTSVETHIMAPDDAVKAGALALFGEKYGDEVRVLSMGHSLKDTQKAYSIELCGGTHVARTGDIGCFKIISEVAVASGVRRIEAVTQHSALAYFQLLQKQVTDLALQFKVSPQQLSDRLQLLLRERKQLETELAKAKKAAVMGGSKGEATEKELIGDIGFIGRVFEDVAPKELRDIVTDLRQHIGSGVIVAASSFEGKASCIIAVTDDVTERFSAVELIKEISPMLGAKGGGGKPDFAQTGGSEGGNIQQAINILRTRIQKRENTVP